MNRVPIKRKLKAMKFTILKTKLEHEIEMHFEDDVIYYVTEDKKEFDLYIEIVENGITYCIEGKYRCVKPIYKKDELICYKWTGKETIPCDLKILPVNHNPNKQPLIDIMDEIIEKEQKKIRDRNRTNRIIDAL